MPAGDCWHWDYDIHFEDGRPRGGLLLVIDMKTTTFPPESRELELYFAD